MKILHISKYYYPYVGGVENVCKYLVDGMPDAERAVVCFSEGRRNFVDSVNGVKVYRVGTKMMVCRQALSLSFFNVLHRALMEFKPDIVHFHWANPFPAAVLLTMIPKHVKLVLHWHMDIIAQKKLYNLIKPIEIMLLKRADLILVTSPNYKEYSRPLQKFKAKVKVLPNAVDINEFVVRLGDKKAIDEIKEKYNGKKIILFVGRHIEYKGLPYLLNAEKNVRNDCEFVIAGDGPLTESLNAQTSSNRIHFVGRLSDDELRQFCFASDIFAFPSITKNEAFGIALAEAMFCKKPAVTFTIQGSGVNWVSLNGITGLEVPNKDYKAYAEAIDTLLADDFLREKFGLAGHKRVLENFTLEKQIKTLIGYYNDLLGI